MYFIYSAWSSNFCYLKCRTGHFSPSKLILLFSVPCFKRSRSFWMCFCFHPFSPSPLHSRCQRVYWRIEGPDPGTPFDISFQLNEIAPMSIRWEYFLKKRKPEENICSLGLNCVGVLGAVWGWLFPWRYLIIRLGNIISARREQGLVQVSDVAPRTDDVT